MIKEQLKQKIDGKTKPIGSLGILEDIALQIGLIQNTLNPKLQKPTVLIFAGDHGITEEGVSLYPKDVTWQMVINFCSGGAAINSFCKQNNINLKIYDIGVDYDFSTDLPIISAKIAHGTRNMLHEPAMTETECNNAILKGREAVIKESENGCNIIAFGEMGIGNTSASALLMHKLTNIPLNECVGKGTGLDDTQLNKKFEILQTVSDKYNPVKPLEILSVFGGLEIASMVGAFLEAQKQNMVILVDGFIATSALLVAYKIDNSILKNCIFCHTSNEHGHKKMLEYLNATPLLNLNMRLGEGTGSAVAFPIVQSAVTFLNDMASMEDAKVSDK